MWKKTIKNLEHSEDIPRIIKKDVLAQIRQIQTSKWTVIKTIIVNFWCDEDKYAMVSDDFIRIKILVIRTQVLLNLILLYAVEFATIFMETPRIILMNTTSIGGSNNL